VSQRPGSDEPHAANVAGSTGPIATDSIAAGFLIGLLVGEGHFGGDGKQAHVILRMHARHEATFRWLVRAVRGSRLYGPYDHGGRHYYQWMCRGTSLWEILVPLIRENVDLLDDHVLGRFTAMVERYGGAGVNAAARAPSPRSLSGS
jgi:hypothetical protein